MNLRAKSQKGFTIVELLIVIVVIAILAAISIVAFTGVQQRARDTQRAANAKTVSDAFSAYNADKGYWPGNAAGASVTTTGVQDALKAFTTVKIPDDLANKVAVHSAVAATEAAAKTAAGTASSANADRVFVVPTGSLTAPTGAYIIYAKEDGGWQWLVYKVGTAA